jgi:nucleoside 2-deoxyribosyltransferase
MVSKTCYLAGPIDGLSFQDGVEWRRYATEKLAVEGIKGLSPQRGKDYVGGNEGLADEMDFATQEKVFADRLMSDAKFVLGRDKFDALNCSVLLVNFKGARRASIGTIMEIAWAFLQGKPIIVVADDDDTLHRNHPMLRGTFTSITNNLDDAIGLVIHIFQGY